jgi:hypothetical protein
MLSFNSLHRKVMIMLCLAACGGPSGSAPDAGPTPAQACQSVGASLCAKLYACDTVADLMSQGLPATEAECVTLENTHCSDQPPGPGYCKGHSQTSPQMAVACAADLDSLTCTQLNQPPSANDVCKTQLCSP